ncbi:hypothetical protein ABGV42_29080 [Paenibacillus pabuli]
MTNTSHGLQLHEERLCLSAFVDKSNNALKRSLCPALSCHLNEEKGNNI